ncbi:MAG: Amidase [Candidatus Angelobacter sp.]|nr:Amidase [Candidatus Angelobacter sp.]
MEHTSLNSSRIDRRTFLCLSATAGAGLLYGGWPQLTWAAPQAQISLPSDNAPWIEATIPELQAMMSSGALTSRELTLGYLQRISSLNPLLHAVIQTNPNAVAIAAQLDNERRAGRIRGPLHGVPILVKDNIATNDNMQTTAGSLALLNSQVPSDAPLVSKLRSAGAVILGKANLSEWANFRGFAPFNGWSARGGFTRDPYVLDFDPCGSSSGSAVAAAENLCAAAIGTETDGSVVCPSGNNLIVGLKPTVGLVPQDGIIPIAHSQDTAGPMARTVTDVAILLGVIQSPFGPVAGHSVPSDYTGFLQRGALNGARIGVDQRYFTADFGGEADLVAVVNNVAIPALSSLGATVVPTDTGDSNLYFDAEFTVLLFEFKVQVAQYLAALGHTTMRSLADLIAFDIAHCPQEMKYFGQEIFDMAEATSGDLSDPTYTAARQLCLQLSRAQGIDMALAKDNLDAIIVPSYSFASSPAAVAGYPDISVPIGVTLEGKPVGIWMYSTFLHEPQLLAFAFDLEQKLKPRQTPQFLSSVPPLPPDAGICATLPKTSQSKAGLPHLRRHLGTNKSIPGR